MTPLDALQSALAAEHAAVYLFGVIGGRTSRSSGRATYDAVRAAYDAHRAARDDLVATIHDRGAEPVAAEAAYAVPEPLTTVAELNDAALRVERRIAMTYGQLVENTSGAQRRWSLVTLDQVAVRQLEFRGTPEMFPGTSL